MKIQKMILPIIGLSCAVGLPAAPGDLSSYPATELQTVSPENTAGVQTAVLADFDFTLISGTDITLTKYKGTAVDVLIPATLTDGTNTYTVKQLGDNCFYNNTPLRMIDLSQTKVESIGTSSFANCSALTTLKFPITLTTIGEHAFNGCSLLETLDLSPTKVESIGANSFTKCSALTTVKFPTTLTGLGNAAFYKCGKLEQADLSQTKVENIEQKCFANCSALTTVKFPTTLTTLGEQAFNGCSLLETVDLSQTKVESIEYQTFYNCSALTTAKFPKTLTTLGLEAFFNCVKLETLDLSQTKVENIRRACFNACSALTTVKFPITLTTLDGVAFTDCHLLDQVDLSQTKVESIGSYCFNGCKAMTTVKFPTTLTTLNSGAYYNCEKLGQVDLSQTKVESIGTDCFNTCSALTTVKFPTTLTTLGNAAFQNCALLEQADLSQTKVESIGTDCFYTCSALTTVKFPTTLTTLGNAAFQNCTLLEQADLSQTKIESIGFDCFNTCSALTTVKFPTTLTTLGEAAFASCTKLNEIYVVTTTPATATANTFLDVTATVFVPAGASVKYQQAEGWNLLTYKEKLTLDDKNSYTGLASDVVESISYTRHFDKAMEWQPLYVPFGMEYADWANQFDIARLNNFIQTDADNDGTIDRTVLETVYLKEGSRTEPNMLYVIRAKQVAEGGEDKVLKLLPAAGQHLSVAAAESKSIDCASFDKKYVFTGIYEPKTSFLPGQFVMGSGMIASPAPGSQLGSFRWYLTITDRNGQTVTNVNSIRVIARGEDELTGIDTMSPADTQRYDIYDINGRLVKRGAPTTEGLAHGIYVINGKKVIK